MRWNYAFTSIQGSSHLETGLPCQDASLCRVIDTPSGPVLLAVASDGAGSAAHSEEGSALVCQRMVQELTDFLEAEETVDLLSWETVLEWVGAIQAALAEKAEAAGGTLRDYACTLLAAVISESEAAFFQVGDGCIAVSDQEAPDEYCWVFWPERGTYANTTFFVTDENVAEHLQFDLVRREICELALFTDGIENLALQYSSQEVFQPFFKGLFPSVRKEDFVQKAFTAQLSDFLNSERVNTRTNDDKTLILASRYMEMKTSEDVL